MFKRFYNSALLTASLEPDGPLLIVKGGFVGDPTAPDLSFVRTQHRGESTVYIPGSSLKGVLRSHVERLLVTEAGEHAAESPFDHRAARRSAAGRARGVRTAGAARDGAPLSTAPRTADVYRLSCEADRMFGSTEIAGRTRVDDALPEGGRVDLDVRYGVAIDRAKQSVRVGPFESEAVVGGQFALRAGLENYELWMLALLLQAVDDIHAGLVQVGHSKSRGFGTLRVQEPTLRVRQLAGPSSLCGAGALEKDGDTRNAYGLDETDAVELPTGAGEGAAGLFIDRTWTGWESLRAVRDAILSARWATFLMRARAAKPPVTPAGGPPRG